MQANTWGTPASGATKQRHPVMPKRLASTCDSCVFSIQSVENRAVRNRPAPSTGFRQLEKRPLHRFESSDFCLYVRNLRFSPSPNFRASLVGRSTQRKQLPNLFEGEPQFLRPLNEP